MNILTITREQVRFTENETWIEILDKEVVFQLRTFFRKKSDRKHKPKHSGHLSSTEYRKPYYLYKFYLDGKLVILFYHERLSPSPEYYQLVEERNIDTKHLPDSFIKLKLK